MRQRMPARLVSSILLFAIFLVSSASANSESIIARGHEAQPHHDTNAAGTREGLAAASDFKGETLTITEISTRVVAATTSTGTPSINHQYHRHGTGSELFKAREISANSSTATTSNPAALSCYAAYSRWRKGAINWANTVASGASTSVETTTSTITQVLQTVNTVYPSESISTYKLCDGSPRVDFEPLTLTSTYTSYSQYEAYVTVGTPVYSVSRPCKATPDECLYLYYGSGISWDDITLMALCGSPAHLGQPCLIMGGPVELAYFPVTTAGNNKCRANGSTIINTGGPTEIEALGTTLTSGSVYLSFKTLYAFQDGFANRIGPTYTDFIMPFPSSAISTQCGGWASAQGPGTALNYADLNFPWPASAYSCMNRCSTDMSWTIINGTNAKYTPPPQCSTIWSDLNPILAMPTEVRNMVPAWSSCSMWDEVLPNFVFDPPRALVAGTAVATPTVSWKDPVTTATASPAETSYTALPETMSSSSSTTSTSASSSTSAVPSASPTPASTWIPSAAPRPSRATGHTAINIEFSIDGHTFTASAGDNAFSISGKTISVGGPAQVVGGETISLALGGFVINSTSTVSFTSSEQEVMTTTTGQGVQVSMQQQSTTAGKKSSSSGGSRMAFSWALITLASLAAIVFL